VSATPSQGLYDSATGLWTVGTVATTTPQTLVIAARVVSPGPQTNTATIADADQFDPVVTNDTVSVVTAPQQADLALSKSASDLTPNVEDTITYTVTVRDNGPDDATNVHVTEPLPSGVSFVSATTSQGTYDPATGVWSVGTVTTAAPQTLLIQATVISPDPQTNTATISHADQFDPMTADNTATATLTPQQADLALAKTVSSTTPNVGDTISYTVTLTNLGPDPATHVQVTELLPAGVSFVSATPSGGTYNSATGLWTLSRVTTASPQTLVVTGTVANPANTINTATITHADQFDPDLSNNQATARETPQQADLALAKTASDRTPNVGDTITYIVTLGNSGPDSATNVEVRDELPTGLTFVSATTSQGAYDHTTGVWTVGTVTTSTPQSLVIQAVVVSPHPQTNSAEISHADQFDPGAADNVATVTVTPQQADLALAKTVNNPLPHEGETITYTVTVGNNGPDAATNAQVTDPLPSGLVFVSAAPTQGLYDSKTGLWVVGTVQAGAHATLVLQTTVVSLNPQTNLARITHVDQFDPVPANNVDGIVVQATPVTPTPTPTPAPVPPTVSSLQRFGFHEQPTEFVLTFSSALDPARAQNVHNYSLAPIGPGGRLGKEIRIVSAVYDPRTRTVTLHPAIRVYLFQSYRLVVNGMAPDGLASPSGTLLDGQGNGKPGSNYVKVFGRSILAGPNPGLSSGSVHKARHSRPEAADSTTRKAMTTLHRELSSVRSDRIGASTAGSSHVRLNAEAVDTVLATFASSRESERV
jgi:uncharacterized repeat protein (TIGR01451 family)